jgi:AcrR family transcriptional regulator
MSMRRIAAELGCDPMAIYRHFANREALLDAVADLALAGVTVPPPSVSWDDRVREILTSVRAEALRHPGIAAHVSARPPLGPHTRRTLAPGEPGADRAARRRTAGGRLTGAVPVRPPPHDQRDQGRTGP